MSSGAAKPDEKRGRPDLGRVGRKLGIAVFWLLLFYMIAMSAFSIIPSLFWPAFAPKPAAPGLARCARELAALDRELLDHAAVVIRGSDTLNSERWFADWDARLSALDGGCGPLDSAHADLVVLRKRIEAMLRSYRRGAQRTQEQIRRALERVQALESSERPKG